MKPPVIHPNVSSGYIVILDYFIKDRLLLIDYSLDQLCKLGLVEGKIGSRKLDSRNISRQFFL